MSLSLEHFDYNVQDPKLSLEQAQGLPDRKLREINASALMAIRQGVDDQQRADLLQTHITLAQRTLADRGKKLREQTELLQNYLYKGDPNQVLKRPGAWVVKVDENVQGDYLCYKKTKEGKIEETKIHSQELRTKELFDVLNVEPEKYAGHATPSWSDTPWKVAAVAGTAFLGIAALGGAAYALARGAAAPEIEREQPLLYSVMQQPYEVWPPAVQKACGMADQCWALPNATVPVSEWTVCPICPENPYATFDAADQIQAASAFLGKIKRFDSQTSKSRVQQARNELEMRMEALEAELPDHPVKGGSEMVLQLAQAYVDLPIQIPEALGTSCSEITRTFSSTKKALERSKDAANKLPRGESANAKKAIEAKLQALEQWRSDSLTPIREELKTKNAELQNSYQQLNKQGKGASFEETASLLEQTAALQEKIAEARSAFTRQEFNEYQQGLKDISQKLLTPDHLSEYVARHVDHVNQTLSRQGEVGKKDPSLHRLIQVSEKIERFEQKGTVIPGADSFEEFVVLERDFMRDLGQIARVTQQKGPPTKEAIESHTAGLRVFETKAQKFFARVKETDPLSDTYRKSENALNEATLWPKIRLGMKIPKENHDFREEAIKLYNEINVGVAKLPKEARARFHAHLQEVHKHIPAATLKDTLFGGRPTPPPPQ